jgi:hypothetical protein
MPASLRSDIVFPAGGHGHPRQLIDPEAQVASASVDWLSTHL